MSTLAGFFLVISSLFVCPPEGLPQPPLENQDVRQTHRVDRIRQYLSSLVEHGQVPGLVALVVHKDKVVLNEALGKAEFNPTREMHGDTIFRLASMTKPITSVAIMILRERGRLDLEDPVSKFIPELANPRIFEQPDPARKQITIRHLLTHQSGLAYNDAAGVGRMYTQKAIQSGVCRSSVTLAENIRTLAGIPLLFEPGTNVNYGMSTDVLGLVIQKVSGLELDKFISKNICGPLGMTDTHFQIPPNKRARLAATFVHETETLRELEDTDTIIHPFFKVPMSPDHPYHTDQKYISGGGGLCGTAADYVRFCQMILNRGSYDGVRILKPDSVREMTRNQIGDRVFGKLADGTEYQFGLGFSVLPDEKGMKQERGWGGIWGTAFRISLENDWAAVLLTQRVFDESFEKREVEFTKLVRAAIDNSARRTGAFDSDGVRIAFTVHGEGTPVVILHGMTGNQRHLGKLRRALLKEGYQVIAFDARGHGLSGKPRGRQDYGATMAEDVRRLLDHLSIDRAHIVGYSMGGDIANKFRELHQNRVLSATLGGVGLGASDGWIEGKLDLQELAGSLEMGNGFIPLLQKPGAIHPGIASSVEVQRVNMQMMKGQDPLALAAILRSYSALDLDVTKFEQNKAATLVIVGENDAEKPFASELHLKMSKTKLHVIKGVDHFGAANHQEFTRVIIRFINGNRG